MGVCRFVRFYSQGESSCENTQVCPGWFSKMSCLWKLTGLSGLTSKRGFVLRGYVDCLLDSRKWFCAEVYRFVRPNFQRKGSHMEVYRFVWLSLQKEFELKCERADVVGLALERCSNGNLPVCPA